MNLETFLKIMDLPLNLTIDEILDMLIIYLRKSRKDLDYFKGEPIEKTLQRHEKELQEYIINIFGKPIPEYNIYREVASGDTIEDRPVMQEVLSLIEKDKYKGVVCIEIERLARGDTIDQGIIAQSFQYTNTKIITPMKIYNLDNEDDLSYFEDGLFQSRKYLKYTKKILHRGRIRSLNEGKYIASIVPYGYNKIKLPNEKGYTLIENEIESKNVRMMADLLINGIYTNYTLKENENILTTAKKFGIYKRDIATSNLDLKIGTNIKLTVNEQNLTYAIQNNDTIESIAKKFKIDKNKINIPNDFFKAGDTIKIEIKDATPALIAYYFNYLKIKPRKATEWTAGMIRNILRSSSIYGYVIWEKRKTKKVLINGQLIKKSYYNKNYNCIKGKHKAILDEKIKEQIEEKFKNNRRTKIISSKWEVKNPLIGLIECGYCHTLLSRRGAKLKEGTSLPQKKVDIDITKLRNLIRNNKNDTFVNMAKVMHVSKDTISHWFATSNEKFRVPNPEKWEKLKKMLNIKTNEFDQAIIAFCSEEKRKETIIADNLICPNKKCKCVGSKIELIEERILTTLKNYKKQYEIVIDDYKKKITIELDENKPNIDVLNHELDKINTQKEKACELVETGIYTKDLFLKRINALDKELEAIQTQINELKNKKKTGYEEMINLVPIIDKILNEYSSELSAERKNKLLSLIIDKIIYTKDKGGLLYKDNFTIEIILKTPKL